MILLFVLYLLIIAILFIVFLAFTVDSKFTVHSDVNDMTVNATLLWLEPFLKADIIYENAIPILTVYIFNRRIYNKRLKTQKQNTDGYQPSKMDIARSLSLSNVNVSTSYGFFNPFSTGVAYIILNVIAQYVNINEVEQNPDFMTDDDYVYINATGNLNIGLTLVNLNRLYNSSKQLSYQLNKGG